jgi:hypothetical protein
MQLGNVTSNENPIKHDGSKPRMSLVPQTALVEVAKVMTFGAEKYSEENYLKGEMLDPKRVIDAGLRHINSYLLGESSDIESSLHPLGHAAASIMMALEIIKRKANAHAGE